MIDFDILSAPDRGERKRIGIIAGAGPEAGIDLWGKVLQANRATLGEDYRGDVDAPLVVVFSIPALGMAMNLKDNEERLWAVLREALLRMDATQVDLFCIACNALHYYADRIRALNLQARFISIVDSTREYLQARGVRSAALLSISPVMALDRWSPYAALARDVDLEIPARPEALDIIIGNVKRNGAEKSEAALAFSRVLASLRSEVVLLACTELPLLDVASKNKDLVDVTAVLAQTVVRESLTEYDNGTNSSMKRY